MTSVRLKQFGILTFAALYAVAALLLVVSHAGAVSQPQGRDVATGDAYQQPTEDFLAAYVLPGGIVPDLCLAPRAGDDGNGSTVPRCDACLLSFVFLVPSAPWSGALDRRLDTFASNFRKKHADLLPTHDLALSGPRAPPA